MHNACASVFGTRSQKVNGGAGERVRRGGGGRVRRGGGAGQGVPAGRGGGAGRRGAELCRDAARRSAGRCRRRGCRRRRWWSELVRRAEGGLLGMVSPNFHGWVIGASHPAGVAADWLTSAWGQFGGFADPTPAAAAVEEVAAGWMLDLLGLPAETGVGFVTGATMANFTALAAARNALLARAGWDVEARGLFGAPEVAGGGRRRGAFLGAAVAAPAGVRGGAGACGGGGRPRGGCGPTRWPRCWRGWRGRSWSACRRATSAAARSIRSRDADPAGAGEGRLGACRRGLRALGGARRRGCGTLTAGHRRRRTAGRRTGTSGCRCPMIAGWRFVRDAGAMKRAMSITRELPAGGGEPGAGGVLAGDVAPGARLRGLGGAEGAGAARGGGDDRAALRGGADMSPGGWRRSRGSRVLNEVVLNQVVLACGEGPEADALTRATLAAVQADGVCYPSGRALAGARDHPGVGFGGADDDRGRGAPRRGDRRRLAPGAGNAAARRGDAASLARSAARLCPSTNPCRACLPDRQALTERPLQAVASALVDPSVSPACFPQACCRQRAGRGCTCSLALLPVRWRSRRLLRDWRIGHGRIGGAAGADRRSGVKFDRRLAVERHAAPRH